MVWHIKLSGGPCRLSPKAGVMLPYLGFDTPGSTFVDTRTGDMSPECLVRINNMVGFSWRGFGGIPVLPKSMKIAAMLISLPSLPDYYGMANVLLRAFRICTFTNLLYCRCSGFLIPNELPILCVYFNGQMIQALNHIIHWGG
jgi:hypothetical protein